MPRRVGEHRLRVGTYHFVGLSHGAKVLDVRFRLVRTKQRLRVRRHHLSDACLATTPFAGTSFVGGGSAAVTGSPPPPPPTSPATGTPPAVKKSKPSFLPPVLHDLNPANASPLVRAIVFALLAGAIAFLAAATLPERATAAVTRGVLVGRHRAPITLGGFMLLLIAALLILHL